MTIMDKACYERGCACYDSRNGEGGIEVVAKQEQGEPVAYLNPDDVCADTAFRWCKIDEFTQPVYTKPQPSQKQEQDEPDELKHIDEQDYLLDVDEKAWRSLIENRGGCRCRFTPQPPCGACINPISEKEMNEVGYTYTKPQPSKKPLTEWQPIETAPKNSTSILIYCPRSERKPVCEAWWAIAYEGDHGGHWQTPIGPNGRGYIILETAPTHWMPLPSPPIEAAHNIKE